MMPAAQTIRQVAPLIGAATVVISCAKLSVQIDFEDSLFEGFEKLRGVGVSVSHRVIPRRATLTRPVVEGK